MRVNNNFKSFFYTPVYNTDSFNKTKIFDGSVYINMDHRLDRRESFKTEINKISWATPTRFSGYKFTDVQLLDLGLLPKSLSPKQLTPTRYEQIRGNLGCNMSHYKIVLEAKRLGLESILIFEDDCIFDDVNLQYIDKYIDQLKNVEWDMFYLGGGLGDDTMYAKNTYKVEADLYCVPIVYATHAYAIHSNIYEEIIKRWEKSPPVALGLDYSLNNINNVKRIVTREPIAFQSSGYSDLVRGNKHSTKNIIKDQYQSRFK